MGHTQSAAREGARLPCVRWLARGAVLGAVLGAMLGACTNDPDVVAHSVSNVAVNDAGALPRDAAAMPTFDAGDASSSSPRDASDVPVLTSAPDSGCTFADALKNAGLGDELLVVAATCKVPLWWFTQGVSGIDQPSILSILLGQTTVPKSEGHTPDACDLFFGIFYYDDPNNAANVILCPAVCDALRARVNLGTSQMNCTPDAPHDAG